MYKLILSNISDRLKNYIAVIIEIVILILVSNILLNDIVPYLKTQQSYNELMLDNIICFSIDKNGADTEEILNNQNVELIGENLRFRYIKNSQNILQPVSESYFEKFSYKFYAKDFDITAENKAIISYSLKNEYQLGKTYSVQLDDLQTYEFTVVGILNNDYSFIPPTEHSGTSIIDKHSNTVFIVTDDTQNTFTKSNIYTLWVNNQADIDNVLMSLLSNDYITAAVCAKDTQKYNNSLELEIMGMPIIIFSISVILCFTGFLSNVLLSTIYFERKYGIYYICGASWSACCSIQLIVDFICVLISVAIAFFIIILMSFTQNIVKSSINSFAISLLIILFIYLISEIIGIIQINKKNIAEVVEGVK